jgi:transcriptional regulator with GAF, ATPase, and Fis domain
MSVQSPGTSDSLTTSGALAAENIRDLLELTRSIHASLRAENPLHVIAGQIAARLGYEHVLLFTPDGAGGLRLRAASSEQYQQAAAQGLALSQDGDSLVSHAAMRRVSIVAGASHGLPGAGVTLALPLLEGDQLLGVMAIHSSTSEGFSPERMEALDMVAEHAAAALLHIQMLDDLRRRIDRLEHANHELQEANARHLAALERTQGTAARQQVVGEIAMQLQHAAQVQEVLETTVRALYNALDGYDISLQLVPPQSGVGDQTGVEGVEDNQS